ncbi:MAG: HD domain-containing protein [Chloroflexota bacterium]
MTPTTWLPRPVLDLMPLLSQGPRLWLVGGAVRDALLGRPVIDLDFVVDGDTLALARRLADHLGAAYYPLDRERGTARLLQRNPSRTLDFASLRAPDIEADLRGRDFTLNAMAVAGDDLDRLLDPTGGLQDLKDKVLRACSPHAVADDPVRALRAVRLAAQFDFHIEPGTLRQVAQAAGLLSAISAERLRDEFVRMLDAPRPGKALRLMDHLGLLEKLCPEVAGLRGLIQPPPHALDAWTHTLATADRLGDLLAVLGPVYDEEASADLILGQAVLRLGRFRKHLGEHFNQSLAQGRRVRSLLFFAALYHDVGKVSTRQVEPDGRIRFLGHERVGARLAAERARSLHLSNAEAERLSDIVKHHMRLVWLEAGPAVTSRAVYRFFRQVGEAGVDVVLLSLADFLATHTPPPPQQNWSRRLDLARTLLEAYFEGPREAIQPRALIRGDELASALALEPGPTIGWLLECIREAQASGEVVTREQAIEAARTALHARASGEDRAEGEAD